MTQVLYADPSILSILPADQRILQRSSAVLRGLRLFQALAKTRSLVSPGRGDMWVDLGWIAEKLRVSRSHTYRIFRRLRAARWLVDIVVTDEYGRERPGFCVALASNFGFGTDMPHSRHTPATLPPHSGHCSPSIELNRKPTQAKSSLTRDTRQSVLPGAEFESQAETVGKAPRRTDGHKRRDPRLRDVALRVDEYERGRYQDHPRCTRAKRNTEEAMRNSVEGITKALERVVASGRHATLEAIELRFRAVVELNWDAAERKQETWDWWVGSAMWSPRSLDRVLEWLEEKRNWIYIDRASGKSSLPARAADTGQVEDDVLSMSPEEQQRAYNERHGIVVGVDMTDPGSDETGVVITMPGGSRSYTLSEIVELHPESSWRKWGSLPGDREPIDHDMAAIESQVAEQLSDCISRGDAPDLEALVGDMFRDLGVFSGPKQRRDGDLAREGKAKVLYIRTTTPAERDADAEAGRKPWEVS